MPSSGVDATHLAYSLGQAVGRREVAERLLGELRRTAAGWRVAEAKTGGLLGSIRSAFFWQLTERWCGRVEVLAAQIEAQLAELRTVEANARTQLEQAAAAPSPNQVPKAKPRRRR